MPYVIANGVRFFYSEAGRGRDTIVFSHGLLMSGEMFSDQIARLSKEYRCIAYDFRGHGLSAATETGYDMETAAEDAKALMEALDLAPCHFVGLSMGGFVGLRLASRSPGLLKSLVLIETSADPEPDDSRRKYKILAFIGRWFGMKPLIGRVMPILFGKTFMGNPSREKERRKWAQYIADRDVKSMAKAVAGVYDRIGVHDELKQISIPTLVIVGEEDVATVPEKAERIAAGIRGAKLVKIPSAGHSSSIEEPEAVSRAIEYFLSNLKSAGGNSDLSKKPGKPRQPARNADLFKRDESKDP